MKKGVLLLLFLTNITIAQNKDSATIAKKDTSWKTSGFFGLNFSQTALDNWGGGGQNNITLTAILNGQATYTKGKIVWDNKFDAQYGIIRPGFNKLFRKNIDQLFALSRFNVDAFGKHWYYAAQADFRSQLAPGYNYVGDSIAGRAISDFFSPAIIQLALGFDYKPVSYFSAFISPLAGRAVIVNRQYLADMGAFGATKAIKDANGNPIPGTGKTVTYGIGGRLVLKFKKDIVKNINLDSYLDVFSNYIDHPQNMVVVFNNLVTFKINKFFTANFISQMYYDDRAILPGNSGPRLQLLSTIAIGFGYKF
ncbi:MAG: DUF3078 domain-containing protein [Bacteroidetes bacterium]|nr:DUF3078 domain-containing protein [Bacteroidota bacterium]